MVSLEGGCQKSALLGNSLAAYPTTSTVLKTSERGDPLAEFDNQQGSTDDCGFSPFGDDISTSRETAFEKIRARVVGTEIASRKRGV
jgi:hypothetical protein